MTASEGAVNGEDRSAWTQRVSGRAPVDDSGQVPGTRYCGRCAECRVRAWPSRAAPCALKSRRSASVVYVEIDRDIGCRHWRLRSTRKGKSDGHGKGVAGDGGTDSVGDLRAAFLGALEATLMGKIEIKRKPDGTRYIQPYLGRSSVTNKPIRPYHEFPDDMTDDEVQAEAARWLAWVGAGRKLGSTTELRELLEVYITTLGAGAAPANTVRAYRQKLAYLGKLAARDARTIETIDLERLYADLLKGGGRGGRALSVSTVRQLHWFLSGAYRWMVRSGLCDNNPCYRAQVPPPRAPEAMALDDRCLSTVISALDAELAGGKGIRREAAFLAKVALYTGLRRGECCALRVRDVDGWRRAVTVAGTIVEDGGSPYRQPYAKRGSSRSVSVDASLLDMMLKRAGKRGLDEPLATTDGSWLRPSSVNRAFKTICEKHGLPANATFHTLRHTHATWLLVEGMEPKTVSERLGHKDIVITLRTYGHVLPGRDRHAADLFGEVASRMARESQTAD